MGVGDITASLPVLVDSNSPVKIKAAIDALTLAATTDQVFVVTIPGGKKLAIFKTERATS